VGDDSPSPYSMWRVRSSGGCDRVSLNASSLDERNEYVLAACSR